MVTHKKRYCKKACDSAMLKSPGKNPGKSQQWQIGWDPHWKSPPRRSQTAQLRRSKPGGSCVTCGWQKVNPYGKWWSDGQPQTPQGLTLGSPSISWSREDGQVLQLPPFHRFADLGTTRHTDSEDIFSNRCEPVGLPGTEAQTWTLVKQITTVNIQWHYMDRNGVYESWQFLYKSTLIIW